MLTDVQYGRSYRCAQINTDGSIGKSTAGNSGIVLPAVRPTFVATPAQALQVIRMSVQWSLFPGATQPETEAVTDNRVVLKLNRRVPLTNTLAFLGAGTNLSGLQGC
jgi:hypothetical protein